MKNNSVGMINSNEAYSKAMVLEKLGISQKFWDKMLDDGLPYTSVGHSRWVTGRALMDHIERYSQIKQPAAR